jgi:AraC-like DNA-binding protein
MDAIEAETSLLIAFRRLILRHADCGPQREEVRYDGSQQRFLLYRGLIEDQLGSELDLQKLADVAQVTRFQVIRDFKRTLGLTPSTYVRDRRLRRAFALIGEGRSLADSAAAAGFVDQSHLSRVFRAAHGMTPGMLKRAR